MNRKKNMYKWILYMGFPPIISMLIQSLYSIIDGVFVAKISQEAFNAISIAFPITNILLSVGVGIGVGISSVIARSNGAKDIKKSNDTAITGIILAIIHSIILLLIGLLIIPYFFSWFTDNEETITLGKEYIFILLLLPIFQQVHIAIEKVFQANGKMLVPMLAQTLGCIINIIFDYIFIFPCNLGIKGAAYATVLGQAASCIFIFIMGIIYKQYHINKNEKIQFVKISKEIYSVGISSTIMCALPSVLTIIFNFFLKPYDENYVFVLGAYLKVQSFIYMPASGLVQGLRPIYGYLYGSKDKERLKEALIKSLQIILIFTIIGFILFEALPKHLMLMFTKDLSSLDLGIKAFRIIAIGFIPSAISLIAMAYYESIGKGFESLLISLSRQLVIPLIVAALGLFVIGNSPFSVFTSFPVAEILTTILAACLFINTWKKYIKQNEKGL